MWSNSLLFFIFLAVWWPKWGICDSHTHTCRSQLHSNLFTTATPFWEKSPLFELWRIQNVKGVPDKEHVFSHLKWAISSRVNVKEGFGECSPSTSSSLLWGLLLFKTAKTSMQVYLKDEGIFWMVFWGRIIRSWARISAVRHFELCFLSW